MTGNAQSEKLSQSYELDQLHNKNQILFLRSQSETPSHGQTKKNFKHSDPRNSDLELLVSSLGITYTV